MASAFASMVTGDSLKRKLFTGATTWPFSIRKTPSRVRPVMRIDCGSTQRVYQKRVMRTPRVTPARSASGVAALPPTSWGGARGGGGGRAGAGVGGGRPPLLRGPDARGAQDRDRAPVDPGRGHARQPLAVEGRH